MAKKNVADSVKRERRGNKEIAVVSLQDALSKVFKAFNTEDYLTVITDAIKDSSANMIKKTIEQMDMQELINTKQALQEQITAIDKQIVLVASRVTAPASATDKEEKK